MSAVSTIKNLGPAYETACAKAGIHSAEALRDLGPDAAYLQMLNSGMRAHFIGYYALVMALQGRPWNDCKGQEKDDLRVRFDALKDQVSGTNDSAMEQVLNAIGTGNRR